MLFYLFFESEIFTPIRVFRYPSFRILAAMLSALLMTILLYPWFIRQLQKRQVGQVIREELTHHQKGKKGTPTMGGVLLVLATIVSTLMWADLSNPLVWLVTGVTFAFAVIGFIDDAMKLGVRGAKGLSEKGKLLAQFAISGVVMAVLFLWWDGYDTQLHLPFVNAERFALFLPMWLYSFFSMFVIAGSSNAVNLTDGLDGLAIGPTIVAAGTLGLLAYMSATVFTFPVEVDNMTTYGTFPLAEYLRIPSVEGAQELAIFCAAIAGAGVGFLWFNIFPAQVFMGDVGSLSLGGALGTVTVLTKNELLGAIIMGIFVLEALSVIIQRYYYKATGKRVFLMAPLHHHYEKKGWQETQIVIRFWIISILLALVALASLKLR